MRNSPASTGPPETGASMETASYAPRLLPDNMFVIRERKSIRKVGVKKLPQSSIFGAGAASVAELFEDFIEGFQDNSACIALALSARPLDGNARDAIEKSLAALGYGQDACTYATLASRGAAAEREALAQPESPAQEAMLDAQALFILVEGLDPLFVVAADELSTRKLGEAYRTAFEPDSAIRVFGRPAAAFQDLPSLLATENGKQRAWFLFKSFPKRP